MNKETIIIYANNDSLSTEERYPVPGFERILV